MFVELHILQSFPPSCLNRDDTHSPKDCEFGGHRRARISSQCLKRAIRWHPEFAVCLGANLGMRTRRLAERLAAELQAAGHEAKACEAVARALVDRIFSQLGPDGRTRALIFVGSDELERLRDLALAHWEEIAATISGIEESPASPPGAARRSRRANPAQAALSGILRDYHPGTHSADIALFGRMVAENSHLNIEAACQVAHALSTHRVSMEMDFFTALDDLKPAEQMGADLMGTLEFSSACYYRYSVISLSQLQHNLGGDCEATLEVLEAFLRASIAAIPAGRTHSTAPLSPPSLILAVVREAGSPWSLVNAFESPVWVAERDGRGLVDKSIEALDRYWLMVADMYGEEGIRARPACWLGDALCPQLRSERATGVGPLITAAVEAAEDMLGG
jgi:CRISPR system Cascade subunit CasC